MEYSSHFQDNIFPEEFNECAKGINNWVQDNPETDPNAYQLTNVFLLGAKYGSEGKAINQQPLEEMWKKRSQDFEKCNISKEHFVYQICKDSFEACQNQKALVNDENSHAALRRMAGIGLWMKQQQRDEQSISYNNSSEFISLMEHSKTLKTFHPELYEKYQFSKNMDVLMKLQLQNDLSEELKKRMITHKEELDNPIGSKTAKELQTNKDSFELE